MSCNTVKKTELSAQIILVTVRCKWNDATAASDGLTGGSDLSNLTTVVHNVFYDANVRDINLIPRMEIK